MANFASIVNSKIGPRTVYKTLQLHTSTGNSSHKRLLIDGKTVLSIKKSARIINNGYLSLGVNPVDFFPSTKPCNLTMAEGSKLILNGTTKTGKGVMILLGKNATVELGENVTINANVTIVAAEKIKIGDHSGIGWDTEIIDTDYHKVVREGAVVSAPIEIGNHVYIARRVMIMKGTKIGDGSVVAAGAIVTRDVPPNCLVGGIPARVLRENIQWQV